MISIRYTQILDANMSISIIKMRGCHIVNSGKEQLYQNLKKFSKKRNRPYNLILLTISLIKMISTLLYFSNIGLIVYPCIIFSIPFLFALSFSEKIHSIGAIFIILLLFLIFLIWISSLISSLFKKTIRISCILTIFLCVLDIGMALYSIVLYFSLVKIILILLNIVLVLVCIGMIKTEHRGRFSMLR